MIDFARIHPFQNGQRHSFEELVCQLASREAFPEDSFFRRVEGAGGDGGVEAYWTKPNGVKTGYQAKYFLRSGEIDWSQVDKSVLQALDTHPELERYIIAFACDLTDKTSRRKGKPGWDQWNDRVAHWKKEAASRGISDIEFVPWPQNELLSRLLSGSAAGIREYFFGDIVMSPDWFQRNLEEAIFALDERFHPEDHVDVSIQKLFSVISRDAAFVAELVSAYTNIEKCQTPSNSVSTLSKKPDQKLIDDLEAKRAAFLRIGSEIHVTPENDLNVEKWLELVNALLVEVRELQNWYWEYSADLPTNHADAYEVHNSRKACQKLEDAVQHFIDVPASAYRSSESKRVAFIKGAAGSGKSHVMANCVQNAIRDGKPAILFLGQRFSDAEVWTQLSQFMGMGGKTPEQILGALNAAGQAAGVRALLCIDAVNEGSGSRFWRNNLASLIGKLSAYKYISCVISCRNEYFELAIPASMQSTYPIFEVRGFVTPNEQLNAARMYLDKRGIARPSTPWLSPEFINPLFLRSVCVALSQDGKSEFPPGLTGTRKILDYYLESMGRTLTMSEESAFSLVSRLRNSVHAVAKAMVTSQADYLGIDDCEAVISDKFGSARPKNESSWLAIFLRNGLLRKDPSPQAVLGDDVSGEEVIRFSFQRFQDFLMAEIVLDGLTSDAGLFEEGGLLNFCINDEELSWAWRGLIDALAVALPEMLGVELVDSLPGGYKRWWQEWSIQQSFVESVYWRSHEAFSERTLVLLNHLDAYTSDTTLNVLLKVAVSTGHPWNAEFLHKNLSRRKMPDRDVLWASWLHGETADPSSNVGMLIEWCSSGQAPQTNSDNQFLAALVLCWFFAASNRPVRDRATKALTTLFLVNEKLFPNLLERFANIDDLYILERLLAAAYGACCIDPSATRLLSYANEVHKLVFAGGAPPLGILLRDYAYGIVEIAASKAALPASFPISECTPPYESKQLRLGVSEKRLEEIVKKAGGEEIYHSATSFMGDFASYEIEPRIRPFIKVPLSSSPKLTPEQKLNLFEDEVVGTDKRRIAAFEHLKEVSNPYSYGIKVLSFGAGSEAKPSEESIRKWEQDVNTAQTNFLQCLEDVEIERFHLEAVPALSRRGDRNKEQKGFDFEAIKRWIAYRAYKLGWTKKRFPHDSSHGGRHSRERPTVERIGKKYQWLALDELLCRMADHYWICGEFRDLPKQYTNPLDLGFERDIDVTLLDDSKRHDKVSTVENAWVFEPRICLDDVPEDKLTAWPFEKEPSDGLRELPYRTDPDGNRWVVLYEHQSVTEKYENGRTGEHSMRIQEFRFFAPVLVHRKDARAIVKKIEAKGDVDILWTSSSETDTAYLLEAPWRNTWRQDKWRYSWRLPDGVPYAELVTSYHWESHLDASLPEGFTTHLPSAWLANELGLRPDLDRIGVWLNGDDEDAFCEMRGNEGGTVCLLKEDEFEKIAGTDYTFLAQFIAERNAWPGGSNRHAAWRRSEGVCWRDGRGINALSWSKDTKNSDAA